MKKSISLVLVIVLGFTGIVNVKADEALTVDVLVNHALENSPVIRAAASDIEAAAAMLRQQQSELEPSLRFGFTFRHWDQEKNGFLGSAPGARQFFSQDLTDSTLQLRKLLADSGRSRANVAAAGKRLESRRHLQKRIAQEVVFAVMSVAVKSVGMQSIVAALQRNILDVEAALGRVQKLREAGKVASVDVLRVEFRLQEALANLDDARHQQTSLLAGLARVVGLDRLPQQIATYTCELSETPELFEPEQMLEKALAERSDYLALQSELGAAGFSEKAARKGKSPAVSLIANANRYGDKSLWGVANGFAGIEIGFPILDGGLVESRTRLARSQNDKAATRVAELRLQILEQIRVAVSALKSARARIERSKKGLELAEEAYRIELLTYENGKGTVNDLLDAQAEVFSARARLIQDENTLVISHLSLQLAAGKTISGSEAK